MEVSSRLAPFLSPHILAEHPHVCNRIAFYLFPDANAELLVLVKGMMRVSAGLSGHRQFDCNSVAIWLPLDCNSVPKPVLHITPTFIAFDPHGQMQGFFLTVWLNKNSGAGAKVSVLAWKSRFYVLDAPRFHGTVASRLQAGCRQNASVQVRNLICALSLKLSGASRLCIRQLDLQFPDATGE